MANIFKAKTLVGRTGIFSHEVISPNLVYNTGYQNIDGTKNFYKTPTINGDGILSSGQDIIGGDLTGDLLSATINKLQGYPLSINSPSPGQTLIYNGETWVPGSNANGGGGGGGRVYYLNFGNHTGIAPTGGLPTTGYHAVSLLGRQYDVGAGEFTSPDLTPQNQYHLVTHFVSASGDPGITNIPAGLWDFNIWAKTDSTIATQTQMKAIVNIYNPINSTYRYVNQSDDVYLYDTTTPAQYILNVTMPQTGIQSSERIYVQLFGKKTTNPAKTITFYFDSYRPSHVHTTIPSVAGSGVVKVIDGVFQTPASTIVDVDVNPNANIQQSKIQNLTFDLANLNNKFSALSGNLITTGSILDQKINSLSGWSASADNLASTGSNLYNSILSLSGLFTGYTGSLDATFASDTQLFITGSTLDNKINSLSGVAVLTFGDQNISGNKNFLNNISVSGTGVFNAIDLNNIDTLNLSGVDISITNGNVSLTNRPNVNGTGVVLSGELNSTGIFLNNKINSLSGYVNSQDLIFSGQIASTGSNLTNSINSLSGASVLLYGNQTISGIKTFAENSVFGDPSQGDFLVISGNTFTIYGSGNFTSGLFVNGNAVLTGVDLSSYATSNNLALTGSILNNKINNLSGYINSSSSNIVFTTGDQTINGLKTFTSNIDIYSGTSAQSLRIFNSTGTNSGEFALIGWQRNAGIVSTTTNALVIGTQASNAGILRDLIITGENIALSPRSGRLYINGTASLNDHLLQTSQCSGNITGYITGFGFTGNYTGNYEGGYFLGRTKITQNTVQLLDSSFGNNYVAKRAPAPNQIFNSAAVSSDGRYQIITSADGYIYVSNDYGNTWTPRITDATRTWARFSAAISADGKYQTVGHYDGYIYVSNDYGNTWNAKDSVRGWGAIAISSDGKYQTAILPGSSGGVWGSNDYGNTWTQKTSTPYLYCVSMSSDGKYQYLSLSYISSVVIRSSDYGNTWTTIYSGSSLSAIATSADGKFVIVGRQGSQILISNNYGASFVTKSAGADHYSVAVSDNGKYMAAGVGNAVGGTGGIYFSNDYGNTWKLITPATGRWSVAMSSNGKYILAVDQHSTSTSFYIFKTDELIDGNLTINNNLTLPSGDFYSYNATGVNSGEFGLIGWRNNQFVIGSQQSQSGILRDVLITGNNININGSGVLNIFDNTNIVGNLTVTGNTTITNHLSAASKSFLIDHPTQVGKKLQYGSLEGPEHGVFVRGKTNDNIINLPNYWPALVDENSISVNLTSINVYSNIYVVDYNNTRVTTNGNNGNYYFYTIYGERKDIPKLTVEF